MGDAVLTLQATTDHHGDLAARGLRIIFSRGAGQQFPDLLRHQTNVKLS